MSCDEILSEYEAQDFQECVSKSSIVKFLLPNVPSIKLRIVILEVKKMLFLG